MSRWQALLIRVGCWWLGAIGLGLSQLQCAPGSLPAPPAAPAILSPAAVLPNDLDWVVRLDLRKMRDALGPRWVAELEAEALRTSRELGGARHNSHEEINGLSGAEYGLGRSLLNADTLWLAFRVGGGLEALDHVLVLRGRFKDFDPNSEGGDWSSAQDFGGDWRRRDQRASVPRARAKRIYQRGNDLLVFATEAVLDSVARQIERSAGDPHVAAPERGVFAFAGRLNLAQRGDGHEAAARYPELLEVGKDAQFIEGFLDLEAGKLRAEISIEYVDETTARLGFERLTRLLGLVSRMNGELKELGSQAKVTHLERHLVMRWEFSDLALLQGLLSSGAESP